MLQAGYRGKFLVGGKLLGQLEQSLSQQNKELEEGDLEDSKKEADSH